MQEAPLAKAKVTPMIRQYMAAKEQHPDALLLFRMGDFYECFFDDAVTAARELDLTLTSREKNKENAIPMAGVPHHAVGSYVRKLIAAGFKVAICDQVEDPRKAKGIVKREVTQVITPGLIVDPESLEREQGNYLLALARQGDTVGLAYIDVSTGEFRTTGIDGPETLFAELDRLEPSEVLLPDSAREDEALTAPWKHRPVLVNFLPDALFEPASAREELTRTLGVHDLSSFGLDEAGPGVGACGAVLEYMLSNHVDSGAHVLRLVPYDMGTTLVIDPQTRRNLELFKAGVDRRKKGSLLHLLDRTATAMGARLLRQWIGTPLVDVGAIEERLDAVDVLVREPALREQLRTCLAGIQDIERLNGKVAAGTASARDLVALAESLEQVPPINALLDRSDTETMAAFASIDPNRPARDRIRRTLADEPPARFQDGGTIRPGFDDELDETVKLSREGKGLIAGMQAQEREASGIKTLKIRYNKVFGYFIEVTRANLAMVPEHYIRKQTLANAERYYTPELKDFEVKVLGAEDRRLALETELFNALRKEIGEHARSLSEAAARLAELDVLAALADVAEANRYVRPVVDDGEVIELVACRHPVIEQMALEERFVPNDVLLDTADAQLVILTGPNMAGKSTIMRQVALSALMAQMGSFVPADEARIGVCDRIFTRVGASDDIGRGQSTFMVEMTEAASILRHATRRSLVLLDEIGRGTSTFDGLAIAWAVSEFIHEQVGCRTLFATHYHELVELAQTCARVRNYNVAVAEWGDEIVFLRSLREGGSSRSYGIAVARLAGLPEPVLERAREVLANLESNAIDEVGGPKLARRKGRSASPSQQLDLFGDKDGLLTGELSRIDLSRITPLEALNHLDRLRKLAGLDPE
jgi:DNA mismatch repair protein MutS